MMAAPAAAPPIGYGSTYAPAQSMVPEDAASASSSDLEELEERREELEEAQEDYNEAYGEAYDD
jgi:hypothetical protein